MLKQHKNELIKTLELGMRYKADIIKLITYARNIEDNDTILSLYKASEEMKVKIVAFCMGNLGLPSRILCIYHNAAFTYASLNEKSAPGQISAQVLNKIFKGLQTRCA